MKGAAQGGTGCNSPNTNSAGGAPGCSSTGRGDQHTPSHPWRQHRALLPATHRPRHRQVHDDDGRDLPPAPVLAAVEKEDAPEGVQEDQHHGHEGCGEQKRGVTREPLAPQARGGGRGAGTGCGGTDGLERSRERHSGRDMAEGGCKGLRWLRGAGALVTQQGRGRGARSHPSPEVRK